MLFSRIAGVVAFSAVVYAQKNKGGNANTGNNNNAGAAAGGNGATGTTLLANAIQNGSFVDGSAATGSDAGQAASATSQNNFINNCAGKTLTNGLQVQTGSCNGITMGDIPAKGNMVSSVITFPETGGNPVEPNTTFNITVQMANLVAGSFTNAQATYYSAPQALSGGKVVGHTHVTVQDLGNSLNPTQALDATQFAFFKGINDAGNGQGLLSAIVTGGLPAGNYRVCTMASASNHQPVLMPVAQRGTPDDCTKFVVAAGGGGGNNNANANSGSANAGGAAASSASSSAAAKATNAKGSKNKNNGGAAPAVSSTSAAAAATDATSASSSAAASATAGTGASTGGNRGGNGRGRGKGRKQRREFIV